MIQPTNSEQRNRLTLCVHIILKMMQCWRKKTKSFNPFPNDKCCRLDQTDRVCGRQFHAVFFFKWRKVHYTGRKHCGKRRNCSLLAISSFSTVFSKDLNSRHVKTVFVCGRDAEKLKIDALIYSHSPSILWLINSTN